MNTELNKNEEIIHQSEPTTTKVTLGKIFKEHREQQELTIEFVAKKLHLKNSLIAQIEQDDIYHIAPTFLRGYIRSYAKLLNLNESMMLGLIENQEPTELAIPKPLKSFSLEKRKRRRDRFFKVFSALIVFTTVGVTAAWWFQDFKINSNQQTNIDGSIPVPIDIQINNTQTNQSSTENTSVSTVANPLEMNNPLGLNTNATQDANIPLLNNQPITNAQGEIDDETLNQAINLSLANHSTSRYVTENNENEGDENTALNTNESSTGLAFSFTADCWIEVRNASNELLFSGLKKSGDSLAFNNEGKPFKLKIGAPSAVSITFDGNPVDMSEFVKSRSVAKLTLPKGE